MRTILALTALLLSSCVTAGQCTTSVPEELRADTFRYVLEKRLVRDGVMPRDDQSLAFGAGRPFAALPPERQRDVTLRAAGYAACLNDRVNRRD